MLMDESWSIAGLGSLLDPVEGDAVRRIAMLLAQMTRADLARLETLVAAGQENEVKRLVHRMVGAFRIFDRVPAFAQIRDVIDAMHSCEVDHLIAQLPAYRVRLLDFVDRLEQATRQPAER